MGNCLLQRISRVNRGCGRLVPPFVIPKGNADVTRCDHDGTIAFPNAPYHVGVINPRSPENKMLAHLPIVILASLHPVADTVPKFDIAKECRFEGGTQQMQERCAADEAQARGTLQNEWAQFNASQKTQCNGETSADNTPSYVELLTCLEMERDVKNTPK
jgi:hypothetical protein